MSINEVLAKKNATVPHLIVRAGAGTGKTTTSVEGLNAIKGQESKFTPSPEQSAIWEAMALSKGAKSICFVAFNKSIATELQRRVPAGVEAMTLHSMSFKAVRNAFPCRLKVDSYRVSNIISEILEKDIRELRRERPELVSATEELVGLVKMNLVEPTEKELSHIAAHYDIDLNGSQEEIFELVPRVIDRCKDVQRDGCIDFNDMIWLTVALDLPIYRYDLLIVDESQDLNRCQQELALKAGERLILMGDKRQAIYGFAGADSESMDRMEEILGNSKRGVEVLPLMQTRRCGKAIVTEAQCIVPEFNAHEDNSTGNVRKALFEGEEVGSSELMQPYLPQVEDGDMALCRVNAPLVSQCFKVLKTGRKATIQGRDVGQGLISTIKKLNAKEIGSLLEKLGDWYERECQKENSKKNPSEQRLIALEDRKECIEVFCEDAVSIEEVIERIEKIFSDKSNGGVKFSSIHKAKGLEARRVFLLEPEGATVPHPMARSAWQQEQEMNLRYVAITRAIEELIYVS